MLPPRTQRSRVEMDRYDHRHRMDWFVRYVLYHTTTHLDDMVVISSDGAGGTT